MSRLGEKVVAKEDEVEEKEMEDEEQEENVVEKAADFCQACSLY